MKIDLLNLEFNKIDELSVSQNLFGIKPKFELIKRYLDWQTNLNMTGNHKVKTSSEVSGSTKKPFRQKGTGNARQGNSRSPVLRGGGVSHGPVVRSHATNLPKKIKKLAIQMLISNKYIQDKIKIFKNYDFESYKTSKIRQFLQNYSNSSICFVYDDKMKNKNLILSCRSLKNVKTLSYFGMNILDILKHEYIFFSESSFNFFCVRFTSNYNY
ncbi:MAG: 50S ribosomal protein L4 [Rickettsia sp.]|nr:50S ribosomal protein L4 [Rickettsia sp.]